MLHTWAFDSGSSTLKHSSERWSFFGTCKQCIYKFRFWGVSTVFYKMYKYLCRSNFPLYRNRFGDAGLNFQHHVMFIHSCYFWTCLKVTVGLWRKYYRTRTQTSFLRCCHPEQWQQL